MRWILGLLLLVGAAGLYSFLKKPNLLKQARIIQKELSTLRGRSFTAPVVVKFQSRESNAVAIEAQLARRPEVEEYGKIARKLGLTNGAFIEDPRAIIRRLLLSGLEGQIGYYDETLDTVFMEKDARGRIAPESFAHEIYHAFQDQHFDLGTYVVQKSLDGSLNLDEVLARRAVVEGEAAYVALLWFAQRTNAQTSSQAVAREVTRRSELDREAMLALLDQPNTPQQARSIFLAIEATPAFLYDRHSMPYRRGLAFIATLHQSGWAEVEKLYSEYPPESTEQILHPEKWSARERPVRVTWPPFDTNPLFDGWKLIADDVLGEAMWRSVFKEQGLRTEGVRAAEGWNGDRYAVLERLHDGELLLLWHTTWDTATDAAEFADAYRGLLNVKYASNHTPNEIHIQGRNVFIVEGSDETSIGAFVSFLETAQ